MIVIFKNNPKKLRAIAICICAVVVLAAVLAGCMDDGLILSNVYAAGIDIGGKTREEAKVLIQRQTDLTFPYEDMVVEFPDETLRLTPADTGVMLDVDALVEAAYAYGRDGSWSENKATRENAASTSFQLELGDFLKLDTDYIQAQLDAYQEAHTAEYADSSVTVEGEMPALDGENYDETAPCQTLVVFLGSKGMTVNMDGLLEKILDTYGKNEFLVTADIVPEEAVPEAIDLEALYEEYYQEPVDAVMDKATMEPIPETWGYDFDLEAALTMLEEAQDGDTLEIPFRYVEPEVTAEKLRTSLFADVLGSYRTPHTSNANRNTNLRLACAAINEKVLMPGEKFDYNTTLGKRTPEKGYKPAGAYVGGATVDEVGGGICQVSSTLYYCTLLADLQINARRAHSYVSSYMPLGMDAAVSWGGPEFAFTNNTPYPIKIEAWVANGYVNVQILGTDTKGYTIRMEYEIISTTEGRTETRQMTAAEARAAGYTDGQVIQTAYTGHQVKSYKCKYDAVTGNLISRTYEASSTYYARNKIVVDIIDEPTEPPTETPTEAPTEGPTQAPTEAPTQAPTEAPTEAPTQAPTEAPTEAPTQAPTEAPTQAPDTGFEGGDAEI